MFYKGHLIGEHCPDLVVQDKVVVEVKSVERLIGVHQAQLLAVHAGVEEACRPTAQFQ